MLKVVGIKEQKGEYNGNPYNNYVLYCVDSDNQSSVITGLCPITIKLKKAFFKDDYDIKELYQKDINVYYNSYGNPVKLDIIK